MLQKIKAERGFTIVELLIVIVVIAILAAISIVAYNGIQNRGKASAAQSLASQIAKKAEAYNTVESSYPANVAGFGTGAGTAGNPAEAKLDDSSKVVATVPTDETKVQYLKCTTGAVVGWYDATKASGSRIIYMTLGGATTPSAAGVTSC